MVFSSSLREGNRCKSCNVKGDEKGFQDPQLKSSSNGIDCKYAVRKCTELQTGDCQEPEI
eukprot:2022091-Ditylum_brightwellii.AAC.1